MSSKIKSIDSSYFCCHKSASDATKIIAIVDIVTYSFLFFLILTLGILSIAYPEGLNGLLAFFKDDLEKFNSLRGLVRNWIILTILVWVISEVGFGILLYFGTKKRSYGMLRTWIFLIIVDSLFAMMVFIQLVASTTSFIFYAVISALYFTYRLLSLWIVHLLLREIMTQVHFV